MLCAILYHLYNFKNVKNTHGEVLLLVNCMRKRFHFFKVYKWYQIMQRTTYITGITGESCTVESQNFVNYESQDFRFKSHWCASQVRTQPRYEAFADLWVDKGRYCTLINIGWCYLLVSGLKLAWQQPSNW